MAFLYQFKDNPSVKFTSAVYHKGDVIAITKILIKSRVSFEVTAFTNGMWRIGVDRVNESILRKTVQKTVGDFHDLRTIN